jgi:hypothetical protein
VTEVTTQAVEGKIVEGQTLLTDFITKAGASLDSAAANQSNKLSNEEMAHRVDVAIVILKGDAQTSQESSPHVNDFATKVNDHTFTYRVVGPTTDSSQESYIHRKLGVDPNFVLQGLKYIGVDVSVKVPILSEATLDTGSNNKTRAEQNRHYEGGLADPIQATNIAIEAICAAKTAGIDLRSINSESWEEKGGRIKAEALKAGLDEGTATVLEKLTAGVIRVGGGSRSGALGVHDDGRLYLYDGFDRSYPHCWAFGARPAPESKI